MAKTSNIRIVSPRTAEAALEDMITFPIAASSTVARGDLIAITAYGTNSCAAVGAAASEVFAGVCADYVANPVAAVGDNVSIYTKCVIEVVIATTAVVHAGEGVVYVAGGNGTNWTVKAASASDSTNIIGWTLEGPVAVGSTCRVLIDVRALHVQTIASNATVTATDCLGLFRASLCT